MKTTISNASCKFLCTFIAYFLLSFYCQADIFTTGQITNQDNTVQWDWVSNTPNQGDWLVIGYSGSGMLQLDNTFDGNGIKWINCYHLTLGHTTGANGTMVISGSGAGFTQGGNPGNIYIGSGENSQGSLTMQNGVSIAQPTYQNHNLYLANGINSQGSMTLKNPGTYFRLSDELRIGSANGSSGELLISDGAVFETTTQFVGYASGGYGLVTVDGSGSQLKTWTNADTIIGNAGTGEIIVKNGGYVYSGWSAIIGNSSSSQGTALITGAGSLWETPRSFTVGYVHTSATLQLARGGKISANDLTIGVNTYEAHGVVDFIIGNTGSGFVDCGSAETTNASLQNSDLEIHVDPDVTLAIGTQYTLIDYGTINAVYNRFVGLNEGDIYTSPRGYHFRINYATDLGGGDLAITATVVELPPCVVDEVDLFLLYSHWTESGCGDPDWCGGADIDGSTAVGLGDFARIAQYWLGSCPAVWPWQ